VRKILAKPIILKIVSLMHTSGYIREYKVVAEGNKILMSCPFHKSGHELRPSCVLNFSEYTHRRNEWNENSELVTHPAGFMYCWTGCQARSIIHGYASVVHNDTDVSTIVEVCRELADALQEDFEDLIALTGLSSEPIEYADSGEEIPIREPTGFVPCDAYPPRKAFSAVTIPRYALNRGISPKVLKLFSVFEDTEQKKTVFPYRDEHGQPLLFITRRTDTKAFDYPKGAPRVIYGAYELMVTRSDPYWKPRLNSTVFVVESIFNALTCWTNGFPAVAMLGTSTDYAELRALFKRFDISTIAVATDNDADEPRNPGLIGRNKLNKYLSDFSRHAFIVPEDWRTATGSIKDINDLTPTEWRALIEEARIRQDAEVTFS